MSAGMGLLSAALGGLQGYGAGVAKSYETQEEEARQARRDAVLMRQQTALAELGINATAEQNKLTRDQNASQFETEQLGKMSGKFINGTELTNQQLADMRSDQRPTAEFQSPDQAADFNAKKAAAAKMAEKEVDFGHNVALKGIEFTGKNAKTEQKVWEDAVTEAKKILDKDETKYTFLESNPSLKNKSYNDQVLAIAKNTMKLNGYSSPETGKPAPGGNQFQPLIKDGKVFYMDADGVIYDENKVKVDKATKTPTEEKGEKKSKKLTSDDKKKYQDIVKALSAKIPKSPSQIAREKLAKIPDNTVFSGLLSKGKDKLNQWGMEAQQRINPTPQDLSNIGR